MNNEHFEWISKWIIVLQQILLNITGVTWATEQRLLLTFKGIVHLLPAGIRKLLSARKMKNHIDKIDKNV